VISFGLPSVRSAADADVTNGSGPSMQRKIFEFGGGDQGRMRALLQLQCLALLGAWVMRIQAARNNSPVVGSVKNVKVALQPSPTPLPSHRDLVDLPGSPLWLHAAEKRQLHNQSAITSAPSMLAAKPDQTLLRPSSHPIVVRLPAAAACESSPQHSPPRISSYILSAKCDASLRRQSSQGGIGQERGRSASPVQLVLLDDRFKFSQNQKQDCEGRSSLSPTVSGYTSPNSLTNDASFAKPHKDGESVAEKEMLRSCAVRAIS
jgi:hypothetical protein